MPYYSNFTDEESEGQESEVPCPVTEQINGEAMFQAQETWLNHYTTSKIHKSVKAGLENKIQQFLQTFPCLNPI